LLKSDFNRPRTMVQKLRKNKKSILALGLILAILLSLVSNVFLLPIQEVKANPDWLSDWAKRVKLTIDHNDIDADLSNFNAMLK